jgi:hypothetical protein
MSNIEPDFVKVLLPTKNYMILRLIYGVLSV